MWAPLALVEEQKLCFPVGNADKTSLANTKSIELIEIDVMRRIDAMTTFPDSHRDLLNGQVATLATIDSDGSPHQTEVWFLYEDGELRLSLNTARLKTRNLRRRPQCSLLLLDLVNPYRYLAVRGNARVEPDDDYLFARAVGAKYESDLSVHDEPGESRVVVTIEPVNVYAVNMGS
jgi:PPOX class probable F420-dependent enzyme